MKIYRTFISPDKPKFELSQYIATKKFTKPCKAKSTMDTLFAMDIPKKDSLQCGDDERTLEPFDPKCVNKNLGLSDQDKVLNNRLSGSSEGKMFKVSYSLIVSLTHPSDDDETKTYVEFPIRITQPPEELHVPQP